MLDDVLTVDTVLADLPTRWLGRPAHVFASLPSTNIWLMEQARQSAPAGTLTVADVQTAGKGRLGRVWSAPPGAGLLFSLLFHVAGPADMGRLLMVVGTGVAAGLSDHLGVAARLKWPNDVLVHDRKLCGILGEATELPATPPASGTAYAAVIGIGLNVNISLDDLPPPPVGGLPPTSLLVELGHPVPRVPLLHTLLTAIETRYDALQGGVSPLAEYRRLCATLGKPVRVTIGERVVEGVAEDVTDAGYLVVRQADSQRVEVHAGDVTLRAS